MKKLLLIAFVLMTGMVIGQNSLKPTATEALLTVLVTDMKENPREGESITFVNSSSGKEYGGITQSDGKFLLLVPKGAKYKVKYKAFSEDFQYTEFDMPLAKDTLLSFEFQLKYDLPKTITLDNVYFDTGKSTFRPESYTELNKLLDYLKLKKNMVIEIGGHTDNVGKPESNLKLSGDRANAVRDWLIKNGIPADRIVAKGYGDTSPVASNDTEGGKQKNRRTEVKILKEK
ncbi:MAG: OmpA family protein [Bacteroidia bacterium]|nr:OmpA family protein [Bacteroidia bacterium]